ncbi:unnamed protein product [Chrysoparadoxa australica]
MASSRAGEGDIQGELQEYLNSKNINSLFVQIVERLLIEKPANPIGFMVEYLTKKYPEETSKATIGLPQAVDHRRRSTNSAPGGIVSHAVSDSESDSDDEDDDYVDDMMLRPAQPTSAGRRVSVSAETSSATNPGELKTVPKSDEERARIKEKISGSMMFSHLDEIQTQQVMDAMFLVNKEPGDCVIKQGDPGDNFYLIDQGTIDVFIKKGGEDVKIKEMGPGEAFGELALMYSTPRTATCKATSKLQLWTLDRISFKLILMATTIKRRQQYKTFLEEVPILAQLTEYEVLTIADALVEEVFEADEVICTQGEPGNAFYIIKEGQVKCTQMDGTGAVNEVGRLSQGNYFGEIALMTSKERQATVTTMDGTSPLPSCTATRLLSLDRKTFQRVMGPMQDILRRNMDDYNKITAANI